jgi:threonyl-tRNA synthetase
MLAEAEKRDHRRLGQELDLFSFPDDLGSGSPRLPPGRRHRPSGDGGAFAPQAHRGRVLVRQYTPHITKGDLYERSGHLGFYKDAMFPPMQADGEWDEDGNCTKQPQDYYLKPMNCPMHNLIFDSRGRSYRELPLRLFEFGTVYRYEKSGVIQGLTRARGFTQDDAHIYCTEDQLEDRADHRARVRDLPAARTTGWTTSTSNSRPRTRRSTVGSDDDLGTLHRDASRRGRPSPASSWSRIRKVPRSTAPRSPCRRGTPSDVPGRCPPCNWTSTCRSASTSSTPPPTAPRSSPIMVHRALFGSIERFFGVLLGALCRCVPRLVGSAPGHRHPCRRRVRSAIWRTSRPTCAVRVSELPWTPLMTVCRRRSATTPPARCPSCCWPADVT